ncbi:DUF3088 domain-containing protein [Marinoscillum sp. MHG1-6]|uniref:DUF3088 domain-containing protein n=1 Tax=Marinoscillum sp. MHG1-6 TaxID=2959627 RepID=UPI0021583246|nr:DUF3088 domain-containing protein [Marinoscillum sp. MHG1-6]
MIRLFLLNPNFQDARIKPENQVYYCPHCAMIEGILHYYPELRKKLEVIYVDFPRPRKMIVDLLGEENQGCPVLVIPAELETEVRVDDLSRHGDLLFTNSKYRIAQYLGDKFGIALPHP